jgi:uncharacterized membrane protein
VVKGLCKDTVKKVIAWRIVSITTASLIAWPLIGTFSRSLGITLILNAAMIVIHYNFERLWERFK